LFYENLPETLIFLRVIYLLAQYLPGIASYLLADPRKQVEATTCNAEYYREKGLADPRKQVEATTIVATFTTFGALADPRKQVEATTVT
tara:strand:- start:251 stop:517 length:267 start_codon:yes stop_codon:yes gene_type:complete